MRKKGYQIFLDYLDTWFFNENATFNSDFLQYFNSIILTVISLQAQISWSA